MDNGDRNTFRGDLLRYLFLGTVALILLIWLLGERTGLEDERIAFHNVEKELRQARQVVKQNLEVLLPPGSVVSNPGLLARRNLRTLIMEATDKLGISEKLASVKPDRDLKKGLVKARVSLRNVTVGEYVDFMLHLKGLSAGIEDVAATMAIHPSGTDLWKIDLTLEAPLGKGTAGKGATGEPQEKSREKPQEEVKGAAPTGR